MMRGWIAVLLLTLSASLPAQGVEQLPTWPIPFEALRNTFTEVDLIVETRVDCRLLDVLLADSDAERARGLMFVSEMPANAGMLFYYPRPRQMSMWMKNTLISLDLLFLDHDGTIINIIERAAPQTLDSRSSAAPASFVLELNAGQVERWGLTPGQRITIAGP